LLDFEFFKDYLEFDISVSYFFSFLDITTEVDFNDSGVSDLTG